MHLLNNTKWVTLSQLGKIITQLIVMITLARFIPPSQFSIMAIATIVVNFSLLLKDLGTSSALIQKAQLDDNTIHAVYTFNLLLGFGIALLIILSSPLFALFFGESQLISILILLSFSFPITSFGAVHLALLERNSKFMKIAHIELFTNLVALIMTLIGAYLNFGIYSLVLFPLVSAFLSTFLFRLVSPWRPLCKNRFYFKDIKSVLGYSGNLTLFNLINYFSRNIDAVIIGRTMSPFILGSYSLAYRIMLFPIQSLTFIFSRAFFPAMSREQNNNDYLRQTYLNTVVFIFLLICPLMCGLILLREPFILFVFGKEWQLTASILVWLAPTAIVQSIISPTGAVLLAKGKPQILLYLSVFALLLNVTAFLLGSLYDIIAFAKFYFIANLINFFPAMYITLKLIDSNLSELFQRLFKPFLCSLTMFCILSLCIKSGKMIISSYSFLGLFLYIFMGVLIYIISCFLICGKEIRNYKKAIQTYGSF